MKPLELPSNRRVPRLNAQTIANIKKPTKAIDPRFTHDKISSREKTVFDTAYKFIYDDQRKHLEKLQTRLRRSKDPEERELLEREIHSLDNSIRKHEQEQERCKLIQNYVSEEKKKVAQGKKPYYLKRSDVKQLGIAKKFLQHQKGGNLDHFIEKKRKRRASKDRKHLPS
uniref:rRNA biogenesis protein RRP36 n=1 Tax=Lygus hesperus TaxID=30085 RepID=A0A146KY01_LYGHE